MQPSATRLVGLAFTVPQHSCNSLLAGINKRNEMTTAWHAEAGIMLTRMISPNSYHILWNWVVSHLPMGKLRLAWVRRLGRGHVATYTWKIEV